MHKTTVCGNKSLPWGRKQTCLLQQSTSYICFGHSARSSIAKTQVWLTSKEKRKIANGTQKEGSMRPTLLNRFQSLQVLSAKKQRHENLPLGKESLNITTISMLWFQQQMWMQQLCTSSHVLLSHYFLDQTTEVSKYKWRLGMPSIYKPSHTILGR